GNDQEIDHGEEMDRMDEEMDHGGHNNDSVDVDRSKLDQEVAKAPENLNDLASDELKVVNTKNITRINENDPIQLSIHVSQTVWPATHEENQPGTVILAPLNQWQYSLAALSLVHHPNDGPLLYWDGEISD
ncbi:ArsR family transcriptional regulator, partial [Flavobacterium sp. IR1]